MCDKYDVCLTKTNWNDNKLTPKILMSDKINRNPGIEGDLSGFIEENG